MNLNPRGFVGVLNPPILPPIYPDTFEPLPKLTIVPGRLTTPSLFAELDDRDNPVRSMVDDLMARVLAEDARMRRLLPAPPPGMRWDAELQSREPDYNFTRNTADVVVRLVYRLRKIGE